MVIMEWMYIQDKQLKDFVARYDSKNPKHGQCWNYKKNKWVKYDYAWEDAHDYGNVREISEEKAKEIIKAAMEEQKG